MGRLKLLKFDDIDEMFEYYSDNEEYLHTETLTKLEETYLKYKIPKTVDIFRIQIEGLKEMEFMSILEKEWNLAIGEMKNYFVLSEKYELAARARNLEIKVFNIIED